MSNEYECIAATEGNRYTLLLMKLDRIVVKIDPGAMVIRECQHLKKLNL
jgi:hypothetical protein